MAVSCERRSFYHESSDCATRLPGVEKLSSCCPQSYPQYVDNLIRFPHSYPRNVDNSFFYPHWLPARVAYRSFPVQPPFTFAHTTCSIPRPDHAHPCQTVLVRLLHLLLILGNSYTGESWLRNLGKTTFTTTPAAARADSTAAAAITCPAGLAAR